MSNSHAKKPSNPRSNNLNTDLSATNEKQSSNTVKPRTNSRSLFAISITETIGSDIGGSEDLLTQALDGTVLTNNQFKALVKQFDDVLTPIVAREIPFDLIYEVFEGTLNGVVIRSLSQRFGKSTSGNKGER